MNYSIVYSSQTGNTEQLAAALKASMADAELICYGAPDSRAAEADTVFVGFWTDKGSCDAATAAFLKTLQGKRVFLFGTAGFGGSKSYFDQILARAKANLHPSNTVIGSYMCQGKMPISVRHRYETMQKLQPDKMRPLIRNFDQALRHPDQNDLHEFVQTAKEHIHK